MPFYVRSLALFALVATCMAQPPSAVPSNPAQDSGAAQAVPILHSSTQLVVVDVVVTDHSGKPVHGLTASDFSLTENGGPQRLRNFEEHSTVAAPVAASAPLPPGVFTNRPQVQPGGAVTILLLDFLNTPTKDQITVRNQLLAYLKTAPPGQRTAIFGLSDHLLLLQGFDSDPAVLLKVMEKLNSKASPVRSDQTGGGIQESVADVFEDANDPMFAELATNLRQWETQQQSLELQTRAKYTIDGFNQLANALAAIPGRKNLIWFSASFPLDVMDNISTNIGADSGTGTNGFVNAFAGEADMASQFHAALDRLSRSQVAVYPIDARGVTQSAVFDADTTRTYRGGSRGASRLAADQAQFISDTDAENSTMTSLAAATGGRAFISTNDLARAVKDSVEEGSNFYSLSYSPTDSALDGKLRHIKVQMSHPGVTLAYRQSYFAQPPDQIKTSGPLTTASAAAASTDPALATMRRNLLLAMTRGGPAPTDILFRVGVVPMTPADKPEDAIAPHNTPTAKGKGPWRRYSVNYQIDPAGLVFFRGQDGKSHADFETIIFVYTPDGGLVNAAHDIIRFAGSDQQARDFFQHGIVLHLEASVPAKGDHFLRIAVHDLHRDHYGAVEVGTSQVSSLVPAEQTAAVPASPVPESAAPAVSK